MQSLVKRALSVGPAAKEQPAAEPKAHHGRHVIHHGDEEDHESEEAGGSKAGGRRVVHHEDRNDSEPGAPIAGMSEPLEPRDQLGAGKIEEPKGTLASTNAGIGSMFSKFFGGSRTEEVEQEMKESTVRDIERGVRTGLKANSDGNTYRLPTMEAKFVDRKDYIPDEIARAKIKLAAQEYEVAKDAFERRIQYIEEFNAKTQAEREIYFKQHAKELKEKATRHVEIQRQMKRELEEKLMQEIRLKEDVIHGLEDSVQLLTDKSIEKDKELEHLNEELNILAQGRSALEGMLGTEAILSSVDDTIHKKELDDLDASSSVLTAMQTLICKVELREAENEVGVLRRAHEKALAMAKEAEETAAKAEEEANEFIVNKLADIEGETREKLKKELDVTEKEKHHKIEQMKALLGIEIDRQKAEIATLKTKYIAEKFQFTAEKSEYRREKDRLSTLIERGQVHLVLNDVVSSVLLNSEQARAGGSAHPGRHVKRNGRDLYRQASASKTSQLGGQGVILSAERTPKDRDTEEELYGLGDDPFAGDPSGKMSPTKAGDGGTIKDVFEEAKAEVTNLTERYAAALEELKVEKAKRRNAKTAVKEWLGAFEKKNGRAANMEDRKAAQDLFVSFRDLTKSTEALEKKKDEALERKIEAEGRLTMVKDQVNELTVDEDEYLGLDIVDRTQTGHRKVAHHTDNGSSSKGRHVRHHEEAEEAPSRSSDKVFEDLEAEASRRIGSTKSTKLNLVSSVGADAGMPQLSPRGEAFREDAGGHAALQKQITTHIEDKAELSDNLEALGDEVYLLKEQLKGMEEKLKSATEEKDFARKQLEDMIKEKRTDVVARLSDETERLKAELLNNAEEFAKSKTEATKAELKLKEWVSRAKNAEDELALRDENEASKLDPSSEKAKLLEQLQKQRDDIKNKGKAATAGWNAAATADEKLEVAEQTRFSEGYNQAKKDLASDTAAMTEQLEKKETRITELMVQLQEQEKTVRDAEKKIEEAEERAKEAQQEVADTIATFGGGEEGGASSEEFERLQDELDNAHDEIVTLSDKITEMEEQAQVSQQTISVLEQLQKVQKSSGGRGGGGGSSKGGGGKKSNLDELVNAAKNSMSKGTSLWKAGKRSDCGDLYLNVAEHIVDGLFAQELKQPLVNSKRDADKVDKAKAAVLLRKALDKFVNDAKTPGMKLADADAAAGKGSTSNVGSGGGEDSPIVKQLQEELMSLKDKLDAIDVEKEKAVREAVRTAKEEAAAEAVKKGQSAEEQEEAQAEAAAAAKIAASAANSSSATAMLLKRAKEAEKQVETLKRQMANLAANSSPAPAKSADGKAAAGPDPAKQAIEIRRLQRRIKQLEASGGSGSGSGSGGGGGGDGKETKELQKKLVVTEKAAAKKYKDLESSTKKEIRSLESRANKAEKSLKKLSEEAGPVKEERDKLKAKVTELLKLGTEVESLRQQAGKAAELAETNAKMSRELESTIDNLKKETLLRKKYKNQIEDMKGAIRVYARCRPMAGYEKEKGCVQVVDFTSDETLTVQSDRGEKEFTFDQVFTAQSKQEEVFEDTRMLVESCLDGYNVCLFAYGQTGSGKTFTMTGSPTMPGLTPRAIDEIFTLIKEKTHLTVKVSTYFVELYLDSLVDLYYSLDNKGKKGDPPRLDIKLDAKKMVYINNCIIKQAETPEDLMDLFNKGNLERHVGATKMNAESSRSHSIFAIMIESFDPSTKRTTTGKLSLVDLAGSERADKTGATADRLKEGMAINKSLSALGDVISALSSGEKFIPYRNSKLTQMMQDSLGGNAKTLMFVNFSPADYNADETVTSLKYAARVKLITNDAAKAAESEEISKLKAALRKASQGGALDEEEIGLIK